MGTGIPSFSQDYPSSDHRNVCRLFCGKSLPVIEEWAFNMLRRDSTLGYVKHIRTCTLLRKKPTNTNKKKKTQHYVWSWINRARRDQWSLTHSVPSHLFAPSKESCLQQSGCVREASACDVQAVHTWPTVALNHLHISEPIPLKKAAFKGTALPLTHGNKAISILFSGLFFLPVKLWFFFKISNQLFTVKW